MEVKTYTYEEAKKVMGAAFPAYLKPGADVRVVKIAGIDKGCPCGGTHVKHIKEIMAVKVEKIKTAGSKAFKVCYQVVDSI